MIQNMRKLFSRVALAVAGTYAALVVILLFAAWRVSDLEARAFELLFIGFPWVLAYMAFKHDSNPLYVLVLVLNVVTVYTFVLALVKIFSPRDLASPDKRRTRELRL
jgi:hypothetical protein